MKCTCGDVMTVDAASREDAVLQLQAMATEEETAAHFAEKHPGEEVPPHDQVMAMIEQMTVEGDLSTPSDDVVPTAPVEQV